MQQHAVVQCHCCCYLLLLLLCLLGVFLYVSSSDAHSAAAYEPPSSIDHRGGTLCLQQGRHSSKKTKEDLQIDREKHISGNARYADRRQVFFQPTQNIDVLPPSLRRLHTYEDTKTPTNNYASTCSSSRPCDSHRFDFLFCLSAAAAAAAAVAAPATSLTNPSRSPLTSSSSSSSSSSAAAAPAVAARDICCCCCCCRAGCWVPLSIEASEETPPGGAAATAAAAAAPEAAGETGGPAPGGQPAGGLLMGRESLPPIEGLALPWRRCFSNNFKVRRARIFNLSNLMSRI